MVLLDVEVILWRLRPLVLILFIFFLDFLMSKTADHVHDHPPAVFLVMESVIAFDD